MTSDISSVRDDGASAVNTTETPITVYIVDDHAGVRAALVDTIDRAPGFRVIGASSSAHVAIPEIVEMQPRVAVVDGHIEGIDGLVVCRQLRTRAPHVSCVIVTAGVAVPWGATEAFEAGAAAFMLKQLSDFPLLDVLTEVARRGV